MIRKYVITIVCAALALTSCDFGLLDWPFVPDNGSNKEGELTPAGPVSPEDGVSYDLDEYAAAIKLVWSKPSWTGVGFATCDVVFDLPEGDFSSPVASYGISCPDTLSRTFTKDEAKSLFNAAVTGKASKVDLKWAVRSAAGGKRLVSDAKTLSLTMTPEPDPFKAGNVIYIGGTGFDDPCKDQHLTYLPGIDYGRAKDAAKYPHWNDNDELALNGGSGLTGFDYEAYTMLKEGGTLYLWSGGTKEEPDWYICPEDNASKTDGVILSTTRTVAKDAHFEYKVKESFLYRIRYNSSTGQITIDNYDKTSKNAKPAGSIQYGLTFRYWPGPKDNSMTYVGNGRWELKNFTPAAYNGFKFLNFGIAGNSDQPMGCQYVTIYNYGASKAETNDKYWYIGPVQGGASTTSVGGAPTNGTWTFPSWTVGKALNIAVDLNDTHGAYYLTLEVAE